MQCAQDEQRGGMCTWRRRWTGRRKAATSRRRRQWKDEGMEREDERGVAKRPDLNELDVSEWAELAVW
jgi:hypothetical protein